MVSSNEKNRLVQDLLQSELGTDIGSFVEQQEWNQEPGFVFRVLTGTAKPEDEEYLQEQLQGLSHKSDSRSEVEYGAELLRGWLIEDLVAVVLRNQGFSVSLSGEDADREFLEETTSDPDLVVQGTKVELTTDYGGYWQQYGNIDLRDGKFDDLKGHGAILLGVDFSNDSVFAADPSELDADYTRNHPAWHKPAYRIDSEQVEFVSFSKLGSQLKTVL